MDTLQDLKENIVAVEKKITEIKEQLDKLPVNYSEQRLMLLQKLARATQIHKMLHEVI